MFAPRHYFFVYRIYPWQPLDLRLPIGGLTVRGWDEVEVHGQAFTLAEERFACKDLELLVIVQQKCKVHQKHALLMEQDKQRADQQFEELMTVEA